MPRGVVAEVAQRPLQPSGVAAYTHRADPGLDAQIRMLGMEPVTLGEGEIVEVHVVVAERQAVLVDAGEQQQIRHQPAQAFGLGLHALQLP